MVSNVDMTIITAALNYLICEWGNVIEFHTPNGRIEYNRHYKHHTNKDFNTVNEWYKHVLWF